MEFSQDILAIRPDADVELLSRAYDVAARCHQDQKRYSGDPYITHPAAVGSADSRVVAIKLADRLHNMRTLQFLPQEKQLRKAREVLDIFLPAAHQLSLHAIGSELEALAFATLIRNRPAGPPRYRVIAGLDIERSTSRPDPVKAEFRIMLYELFEAALRSADIGPDRRGPFMDRGDGLLVLIDPAERASLLSRVVPVFAQLLAGYNAGLPPERCLRVRAVVHAGDVRDDDNGCFGEALDIACRLLDAPEAKAALGAAPDPLLLVVSSHIPGPTPGPRPIIHTHPASPTSHTPAALVTTTEPHRCRDSDNRATSLSLAGGLPRPPARAGRGGEAGRRQPPRSSNRSAIWVKSAWSSAGPPGPARSPPRRWRRRLRRATAGPWPGPCTC